MSRTFISSIGQAILLPQFAKNLTQRYVKYIFIANKKVPHCRPFSCFVQLQPCSFHIQRILNNTRLYSSQEKSETNKERHIHSENVVTIPNILTVGRMLMCPIIGYLAIHSYYSSALGLFIVAGISDLLDGWIARTYPSQSSLAGSFLDPMADKLLVGTLMISLTYQGLIPIPLTLLIIARDVLLVAGGFYIRYVSLSPPRTLQRYFDVTHATAQLAPTGLSKLNTALQLFLIAATLAVPTFQWSSDPYLPILWYVTGTTTTLSGLHYVLAKNTYRILRPRAK